jgi:hypothetical protein
MLITVMVQVHMAVEGAGVSGMAGGVRKVIKKPPRLQPVWSRNFEKQRKINVSLLVMAKFVWQDSPFFGFV